MHEYAILGLMRHDGQVSTRSLQAETNDCRNAALLEVYGDAFLASRPSFRRD